MPGSPPPASTTAFAIRPTFYTHMGIGGAYPARPRGHATPFAPPFASGCADLLCARAQYLP